MSTVSRTTRLSAGGLEVEVRAPQIEQPDGLLVLIHGRGADEFDLAPLGDLVDPTGRWAVACPRGPMQMAGMPGAHWYVVQRVGFPHAESFADSYARLGAMVDELTAQYGLSIADTILGGFSQGAVMSLAIGLGEGRPRPRGILAFSGFIPEVDGFDLDRDNARELPVAIIHGTMDEVIPVGFGERAEQDLIAAGANVRTWWPPIGHGIEPRTIEPAWQWLTGQARHNL